MAADSTIFLIMNFLIALSFGTQRRQLVQLTFTTCPLPCLERPPFLLFLVYSQAIIKKYEKNYFTVEDIYDNILNNNLIDIKIILKEYFFLSNKFK